MSLSAAEQYLLELINRARLDPQAEAVRYGMDLNEGLSAGEIGTQSLQVLAANPKLAAAADSHSAWMLSNDVFSHTGANNSTAADRMKEAGYSFIGSWNWRENLAWLGSTGGIDLEEAVLQHHEGLFRSPGHRVNTFTPMVSEIGVAQVEGSYTYQATTYNSSMLTEVFAKSGSAVFVTGVAYDDHDGDGFYSVGEGRAGMRVWTTGAEAATADAGGYNIAVSAQEAVHLTVADDGGTLGHLAVDTSDGNVKLDLVTDEEGAVSYGLSGSATLIDGVLTARLLGLDDLDLAGRDGNNRLSGNEGANTMRGGAGHDRIWGQQGDDLMMGGRGRDKLRGGQGDDDIQGGAGRDRLYGNRDNDDLSGGRAADKLFGGSGDDTLSGNRGHDRLYGGTGADLLFGNGGGDTLFGGRGDDVLTGGGGADVMVFTSGHDTIADFEDDIDTIAIAAALADGRSVSDLVDMAHITQGDAVLDFGGGDVLTISGVGDIDILANDLIII